ncbi:MAG: class I SAM-dependent methyltransferase [Planctomycetes bacterium]|nr:class I SAM-dependent methyltransferase [Planctomycetota bacterium]NUQ36177.1 class I SAM-dependent methyltransferase [Planctomycetaceae bacterium]
MANRERVRELARTAIDGGTPLAWFERCYQEAAGDTGFIPWVDLVPNPALIEWVESDTTAISSGTNIVVVGCGLGDNAEAIASRGAKVTAFDISPTAIDWCKTRFPRSRVRYAAADATDPPASWRGSFDLAVEIYTLQVLPPEIQERAQAGVASLLKVGGKLLSICRGREDNSEQPADYRRPLTRGELERYARFGLKVVSFDDFLDNETPPVRRFRALFRRETARS